ncbi:MAG: CDP-glucose 4,6-dehydratase [Gammaproteobacteria bacterium]
MKINETFWTGKRVLVTGHTGFKGSWLSLWLSKLGANVCGVALAPETELNLYDLVQVDSVVDSYFVDINDAKKLSEVFSVFRPEIVLHLAAQALVRESYQHPIKTFSTNVLGTLNVLEACRRCNSVAAIVVVTTDKCYENKEWHWGYRETDPLGGYDPYSASKACAEIATNSWRMSFMGESGIDDNHIAVATARAGNVIGGGDWAQDRLVPDLIKAISENRDVVLRNPEAMRPWQHVLEPLSGYLMLAEKLFSEGDAWASAWNFGPNDTDVKSVAWIAEKLIEKFDSNSRWTLDSSLQPHEATYLKLDCSRANQVLGWKPVWSLDTCLDQIVGWELERTRHSGEAVKKITYEMIERYELSLSVRD